MRRASLGTCFKLQLPSKIHFFLCSQTAVPRSSQHLSSFPSHTHLCFLLMLPSLLSVSATWLKLSGLLRQTCRCSTTSRSTALCALRTRRLSCSNGGRFDMVETRCYGGTCLGPTMCVFLHHDLVVLREVISASFPYALCAHGQGVPVC